MQYLPLCIVLLIVLFVLFGCGPHVKARGGIRRLAGPGRVRRSAAAVPRPARRKTALRLAQPPPSRLAIPLPTASLLTDDAAKAWSGALADDALVAQELPASAAPVGRGDWRSGAVRRPAGRGRGAHLYGHGPTRRAAGRQPGPAGPGQGLGRRSTRHTARKLPPPKRRKSWPCWAGSRRGGR